MEEICVNVDRDKSVQSRPSGETGPRRSERRFHGAVVLGLGLLVVSLLAVLIGFRFHHYDSVQRSAAELSAVRANMTASLQASEDKLSSLTEEKDWLNVNLTAVTQELNNIKSLCKLKKTCPAGWRMFNCSCYFLSRESGSWLKGKEDCSNRGADLVVIDSTEEQMFLSTFTESPVGWIGLTDKDKEGTWKWIDGTPLTQSYWEIGEPNSGGGNEHCAHIRMGKETEKNWNDLTCHTTIPWICEKVA